MSEQPDETRKILKERLFQEKNSDKNTKLWVKIWVTIIIIAFFTGWTVAGAYYSIEMNKEVQRALDILAKEHLLMDTDLPPELRDMFIQYDVNASRNHSNDSVMKLKQCGVLGCKELT